MRPVHGIAVLDLGWILVRIWEKRFWPLDLFLSHSGIVSWPWTDWEVTFRKSAITAEADWRRPPFFSLVKDWWGHLHRKKAFIYWLLCKGAGWSWSSQATLTNNEPRTYLWHYAYTSVPLHEFIIIVILVSCARWMSWSISTRTSMSMQTLKLPTSCWVSETQNRLVHCRSPLIILHVCSILQNVHFMYVMQSRAVHLCDPF